MSKLIGVLGLGGFLAFIVVWVLFWPFAIIWAVNTLFAFNIAYSFWTWLAVVVLTATFGKASVNVNKS